MKYRIPMCVAVVCLFVSAAFAQKVPDKPYNQWGKEDALKIVNESAWAKTYQSTSGATGAAASQVAREQGQSVSRGGSDPRSVARDFGPPPIRMRLHSGLPLRQAMVRLQQLDNGYDKMNDADKAAFDASKKGFLDCTICKNYYVITITKDRDAGRSTVEEGVFQGMTFEDLKGQIKIENDKGEMREIVQFNAPKGPNDMAVMYFKRTDEAGKDLITAEAKSFKIVFSSDFRSTKNRFAYLIPNTMDFRVDKLMMGESLMF
jgi:hypothetical protein